MRGVQDLRYFLDDIIYDCCPNVLISVPQLSFSRAGFPINFSSRCGIFLFKILKIILLGMTFFVLTVNTWNQWNPCEAHFLGFRKSSVALLSAEFSYSLVTPLRTPLGVLCRVKMLLQLSEQKILSPQGVLEFSLFLGFSDSLPSLGQILLQAARVVHPLRPETPL